ncbi:MAG: ribosome biogenesis GTP-binding protein YihA/YsxC [Desulfotignum sp.]
MKIHDVQFVKSAVKPDQYPDYDYAEIAFAGRSNVGKSSMINTLIQRKDMVKTSSRPGCTQLINFFLLNDTLSLVDLPGYGYAKVSKKVRAAWQPMVETYLAGRSNLLGLVLILDIRRDPRQEEFDLARWLTDHAMPYLVVLTKADKLSKNQQQQRAEIISARMGRDRSNVIVFSAKTRLGRETILDEITRLLDWYQADKEDSHV